MRSATARIANEGQTQRRSGVDHRGVPYGTGRAAVGAPVRAVGFLGDSVSAAPGGGDRVRAGGAGAVHDDEPAAVNAVQGVEGGGDGAV